MQDLGTFLSVARSLYEEAKINFNTGKCTAEQLENVRLSLVRLENAALAMTSTPRGGEA